MAIQNSELKPYLRVLVAALALWASLLAADPSHAQSNGDQNRPFKGELRAALIVSDNGLVTRNPQGELSGILVEIANAMATSFSVPLHLVPYNNIVRYNLSIGKDEWDVALAPRDLSRIERVAFSETFLEVDNSYVARPGSSLNSVDDVDHTGIRVAVAEHSLADGFLTRTLKKPRLFDCLEGSTRHATRCLLDAPMSMPIMPNSPIVSLASSQAPWFWSGALVQCRCRLLYQKAMRRHFPV